MVAWMGVLCLYSVVSLADSLPTNMAQDAKKPEQTMRPKPKRAQEMLMFGNQQNHQPESIVAGSSSFALSNAEKRTPLSSSWGLGGLKVALSEEEPARSKTPSNNLYDRDSFSPYERNYDYGKVLMNELGQELSNIWDVPYSRYYLNEDRRKRSEKAAIGGTTTVRPVTASYQSATSTQQSAQSVQSEHSVQSQVKRSVPIYQEPRFKRELNIDPEDVWTLLSLWENERRNRNWHKYMNEEYENLDEDGNLIEEEDPRNVIPWLDSPMYPVRRYGVDSLSPSDIGIVRTHPLGYYEQYGNQYGQQFDPSSQYVDSPQYGLVYPQQSYYNAPEKRFMVSRKRSQTYDPYSSAGQYQMTSQNQGFPYQHRLVY